MASIKFGELALSMCWRNLNLVIRILSAIGTHAIVYIGEFFVSKCAESLRIVFITFMSAASCEDQGRMASAACIAM